MASVQAVRNDNLYQVNFRADNKQTRTNSSPFDDRNRRTDSFEHERKKQNLFGNAGKILAPLASLAIIVSTVFLVKGMKGGAGEFKLSNLEFKNLANDETVFDIKKTKSLHPKVKQFFSELIEKGEIPENIAKRAGTLGEAGTNSILLLGGSGVGKTEVIKAYAKATNADYVAIKLSDFSNSYVNGTSQNITAMIKALVKRAKENPNKQLVISLDEVDALVKVTAHDSSGEISKNRQSLLTGMDELLKLPNVKLFSSTNANVKDIDGAFLRRCGYNFTVPMPDQTQLMEALKFQLRKCEGAMENEGAFFKDNKELNDFIKEMVDRKCAFGDVANICKAAKDKYALEMKRINSPDKKFDVKYLKDTLNNIETTAGEKAAKEGSII